MIRRADVRWALSTIALAPMAAVVYFVFEWLFFVTKPSPLSALRFGTQAVVLLKSPLAIMRPLVAVQALASAVAAIGYPRLRGIAVVPAALVLGLLCLVLVDNFTYTILGFGVLTTGAGLRMIYAALLPSLIVVAGAKLVTWASTAAEWRLTPALAMAVAGFCAIAPSADVRTPLPASDLSAPPQLAGARPDAPGRPNILFLGLDGVDATSLSAYGYERPTTPFLEKVRDQSLFFENAFSNVGRTHGSLVALLTGRLPFSTHVTFPPTVLQGDDAHRNLPELLERAGYTTLQLGMRHYADAEDANLLGFDAANYRWQRVEDVRAGEGPADETDVFRAEVAERLDERVGQLFGFRHAIDGFAHIERRQESAYWSDERRIDTLVRYFPSASEPWFVHAHLLDTHCCGYQPPHPYFSHGPSAADDARDSQLRDSDAQVRTLFDALEATGRLDRTIVVIYSDHTSTWTTTGRVPLMIRFPRASLKDHVRTNVQLVDVAPTMLAYLGMAVPEWMDGMSLLRPARIPESRSIFGISEVAERQRVTTSLLVLRNAGPPNYGAGSATLVFGALWFELTLSDGRLRGGRIAGHADGAFPTISDDQARMRLLARLASFGFIVRQTPQS